MILRQFGLGKGGEGKKEEDKLPIKCFDKFVELSQSLTLLECVSDVLICMVVIRLPEKTGDVCTAMLRHFFLLAIDIRAKAIVEFLVLCL